MQMMDASSWTCSTFEAQKWRKRKCKHCFQDIELHTLEAPEDNNVYSKPDNCTRHASLGDLCLPNDDPQVDFVNDLNHEVTEITRSIDELEKWNRVGDARVCKVSEEAVQCKTPVKDCTHVFRKRSRTHDGVRGSQRRRGFLPSEVFASSKDDLQISTTASFEEENIPPEGKCVADTRTILSRLSTAEFSSTSSLASFDPLEDNTLSSYSCSGSRDNLDGFASGDDLCFPDGSNEVRVAANEGKLVQEYMEKIEHLEDELKSLEREKGREIQASDRELQGLKLELATLSARENISIVKNRLEIEGKNQVIDELKDEIVHLQSSIDDLSSDRHSEESRQDFLQGEVRRRDKRILCLEEEKKSLEERLSLAEDLQQNDRDLLDVLRHQLTTLETDLLASEDRKKQLEMEIKNLKIVDSELREEKEASQKYRKHAEFLSGKLKLREQHVSYLEEDNVQMQQQKTELEGKLQKSKIKVDSLNKIVKELKEDILKYGQEVKQLSEENCQLEQAHWQVVVNQSDASGQLEHYVKDLEKRVCLGEARIRELECENESLISQSSEMLENLVSLQNEADDSKRQLELMTESYNRLQTLKTDQDKRMITLQRKLKKLQKEKKRFQIEKQEAEEKISQLKLNDDKVLAKCDDIEKGYKMLQLKLQSTEAKLTMVERNKIYMESKLDEYEKKYKSSKDVLSKVNCVVDNYLNGVVEAACYDVGSLGLESIEVKLYKVLEHSNRSTSELDVALRKNHEFVSAMSYVHVELEKLRHELNSARVETVMLKNQLEDKEKRCDQLESCFATNIACLSKQNDVLEEKLGAMKVLKSVIEDYEGGLKSKNNTKHNTVGDCNLDSPGANEPGDNFSDGVHTDEMENSLLGGYSKTCAGSYCFDVKNNPEQSAGTSNGVVLTNAAAFSDLALSSSREDLCIYQDAKVLKEELGCEYLMHKESKCDLGNAAMDREAAHEEHFETQRCGRFDDELDRIALDISGNECFHGGNSSNSLEENAISVKFGGGDLNENGLQLVESNRVIEDDLANIEGSNISGDSNEALTDCEMDPERPYTSVKCVFKGETNGLGSILDYSAMQLHKDDDDEFRKDLDWMQIGDDRNKSIETNAHYYTVAVSNLDTSNGRSVKGPVSDLRPLQNTDTAVRRHKFGKGSLMQISQEESGAITLTIPRSSLDETAEDDTAEDKTAEVEIAEDEIEDERLDQLTCKSKTNIDTIRVGNHGVSAKDQEANRPYGNEIHLDLSQK